MAESLLCETTTGRNVFDAFFQHPSLFLLNKAGKSMMKKHGTTNWMPVCKTEDESTSDDDEDNEQNGLVNKMIDGECHCGRRI
jgi:hypothetical protein